MSRLSVLGEEKDIEAITSSQENNERAKIAKDEKALYLQVQQADEELERLERVFLSACSPPHRSHRKFYSTHLFPKDSQSTNSSKFDVPTKSVNGNRILCLRQITSTVKPFEETEFMHERMHKS